MRRCGRGARSVALAVGFGAAVLCGSALAANQPPTVSLTAPAHGAVLPAGSSVTLAADASDSDGTITKVEFYRGSTKLGTDTTAPYGYTWSNLAVGTYTLTAKATDNRRAVTTSASRTLTVVPNTPPTVSLTAPADGAVLPVGSSVTLTADASDSGGAVVKVEFYNGTTLLGTDTTAPYSYAWSNLAAGTYTLTAKATDSSGAVTASASRTLTVAANQAPTVSLSSPLNNAAYTAPAIVQLAATAADPDNALAKVEFFQNGNLIATVLSPPYAHTWQGVVAGTYQLTARATDALGAETLSAPVTIAVAGEQAGVYYIHTDHLNTPRLVTDEQNRTVWRNLPTTEPFGNAPVEEDPDGNSTQFVFNLRFPGQYFDRETNLNYNGARDYDPSTGRYPTADPLGLAGGDLSLYLYAKNNPLSYVDPTGKAAFLPLIPIILQYGGAAWAGWNVGYYGTQLTQSFQAMSAIQEALLRAQEALRKCQEKSRICPVSCKLEEDLVNELQQMLIAMGANTAGAAGYFIYGIAGGAAVRVYGWSLK